MLFAPENERHLLKCNMESESICRRPESRDGSHRRIGNHNQGGQSRPWGEGGPAAEAGQGLQRSPDPAGAF